MFLSEQFQATEWSTAEEKAKFANWLTRFMSSGFKSTLFYKWAYSRLSRCFGHIAHYDRGGFHQTWFASSTDQRRFVERIEQHTPVGDPKYTYSDVERAVQSWVCDNKARLNDLIDKATESEQVAATHEKVRRAGLEDKTTQQFLVVSASANTGAFGHRGYCVIARDGSAYEIGIIPHNRVLSVGQVVEVPLSGGRLAWERLNVECPRRLRPDCPREMVEKAWPTTA